MSFSGGPFEQGGITIHQPLSGEEAPKVGSTVSNEEPLEINTVV